MQCDHTVTVYLNLTQNITNVINEEKASLCFAEAALKLTMTVTLIHRGAVLLKTILFSFL